MNGLAGATWRYRLGGCGLRDQKGYSQLPLRDKGGKVQSTRNKETQREKERESDLTIAGRRKKRNSEMKNARYSDGKKTKR